MTRGPVDTARLIWAARSEASRLHRLEVESARLRAQTDQVLTDADARTFRCPGCGEWRYESEHRHLAGSRRRCGACGARRPEWLRRSA